MQESLQAYVKGDSRPYWTSVGSGGRRKRAGVVYVQVSDQGLSFPPPFSSQMGQALIH